MSDSSSDISDADPPWGSLVAEKYILHHWDAQSLESVEEQRTRLVHAFIQAGPERQVQQVDPSKDQITSILDSWRTPDQRALTERTNLGTAIWLRTCYSPGSDEKHAELIQDVEMDHAVDGDHRVLNDPELYNYGSDWQQIFSILPELLEPEKNDGTYRIQKQNDALAELRAYAQQGLAAVERRLMDNLTGVAQGRPGTGFCGEELEEKVAKALQSTVHESRVVTWLILEDEEALESGNVAVIFLDAHGRVVRLTRESTDLAQQFGGAWFDCCWDEFGEWDHGELGVEYRSGGACRGLLLENLRGDHA
ncbi:MAG: hypothetical protein Q9183_002762 [Haloplaca sp. 2 TL-2023]